MSFSTCFRLSAAVAALAIFNTQASAVNDVISEWNYETNTPADVTDNGTGPTVLAEIGPGSMFGLHASAASDWSTPAGNGSANSYSVNNWALNDYFQFSGSTTGFSDIGLIFDATSSNTGPRDFRLEYSINGTDWLVPGITYSVLANGTPNPPWSSGSSDPNYTIGLDLRTIEGLNNQDDVYFRLLMNSTVSAAGGTVALTGTSRVDNVKIVSDFAPLDPPPPPPAPRLPQPGDVVLGLNNGSGIGTFNLVSGPVVVDGGERAGTPWETTPFIQSVEFDNYDGQAHNARGNLLGVDFGGTISQGTGLIYSFATQGSIPAPAGELIGNTRPSPDNIGHDGSLTLTRLAALSVSPDNTKIAVGGFDTGRVIVYDYTAGDTEGAGALLSGGRETSAFLTSGSTQGTAWIDDNTVVTMSSIGDVYEVNATTMAETFKTFVSTPSIGSDNTYLAYNPDVSPYLYALYSGADAAAVPESQSVLYIFDPANSYALLTDSSGIDLSGTIPTGREIALDAEGNLFISTRESNVYFIEDVVTSPGTIADNSAVLWYDNASFANHIGMDIGFGEDLTIAGDHNGDGMVDARDYVVWRKNPAGFGGAQGYTDWVANFGTGVSGSGGGELSGGNAAVPEPASLSLLAIGLAALWCGRRRAA